MNKQDAIIRIGWSDTYLPQDSVVFALELLLYRGIIHFHTYPYAFMNEEGAKREHPTGTSPITLPDITGVAGN